MQETKKSKNPIIVPIGFRFFPKDEELITQYLYKKVIGKTLPCDNAVKEYDIYSKEPWEIWDMYGGAQLEEDEDLYFFTKLKKRSFNDSIFGRKIGSNGGSWIGEDMPKYVQDLKTSKKIAIKKRFRYKNNWSSHDGCWIMHEFSIDRSFLPNPYVSDYVLCKIQKKEAIPQKKREFEKPNLEVIDNEQHNTFKRLKVQNIVIALEATSKKTIKSTTRQRDTCSLVKSATQRSLRVRLRSSNKVGGEYVNVNSEDDQARYSDWANNFAMELLEDQPTNLVKEIEIEMLANKYYIDKWLDWEMLS